MNEVLYENEHKAVLNRIIDSILDGIPLKKAVAAEGIHLRTFNRWLSGDREASLDYVRAQELLADVLVDDALEIVDTEPDAQKARNQADMRKWIASKRNTKRYGDRVDLNVTQTLDIGSTLQEARARLLRPVRDQLGVNEPQVIDLPSRIVQGAPDNQSVDRPRPGDAPDIFS